MLKINLIGTIFGTSGYDSHCRQLANALFKLNEDIKLDVPLPQDYLRLVNDNELKMINCLNRTPDVTISVMTPPYWKICLGDNTKKFVGFLVWEGDKIPLYWLEYLLDKRVDQIWVPSKHTKDAIKNTLASEHFEGKIGTEELLLINKVKIVPHGVDLSIFKPTECKRDSKFTFICNKGWRGTSWDRGGVQYLLKAFCEEFKKEEEVELLLKLNASYLHPSQVTQALDSLNLPQERPEIKVLINDIPYTKLPELYCMGDVFVCTTRAEAFNLPGIEAMACGLPTIQTSYGGQVDYMSDKNSIGINYVLECFGNELLYEGILWATPNNDDIRKTLRYAFNHKEEMKEKGKQALEDSKNWSWNISAQKAMKYLTELFF